MHFPLSLSLLLCYTPAVVFVTLRYPLLPIRQSGGRLSLNSIRSILQPSTSLRIVSRHARRQRRSMEWLTFEEFRRLLEQDLDDLVVLDLRLDARRVQF